MNEWIDVKDELPKEDEAVLIHDNCHGNLICFRTFYQHHLMDSWTEITTGENECPDVIEPTHWMPLPEFPDV